MNFAKGIKYLGYLFTVVGLLILAFIAGDDPEARAKMLMEGFIIADPEFVGSMENEPGYQFVAKLWKVCWISLVGGVVLFTFGHGATKSKG